MKIKTAKASFEMFWKIVGPTDPDARIMAEYAFYAGLMSWSAIVRDNVRQGVPALDACRTLDAELQAFRKRRPTLH